MKKSKEQLRSAYNKAVEDYTSAFLKNFGLPKYDESEWVANRIGEVYQTYDDKYVEFSDMKYCVDNDVDYETFCSWYDYTERALMLGITIPNLDTWCHDGPRLSEEQLKDLEKKRQHIQQIKDDLNGLINDYSQQLNPY